MYSKDTHIPCRAGMRRKDDVGGWIYDGLLYRCQGKKKYLLLKMGQIRQKLDEVL